MAYRPHRYGGVGGTNGHQPSSLQPSGSNGVTTGAAGTASNGNGAASGVTAVSGAGACARQGSGSRAQAGGSGSGGAGTAPLDRCPTPATGGRAPSHAYVHGLA